MECKRIAQRIQQIRDLIAENKKLEKDFKEMRIPCPITKQMEIAIELEKHLLWAIETLEDLSVNKTAINQEIFDIKSQIQQVECSKRRDIKKSIDLRRGLRDAKLNWLLETIESLMDNEVSNEHTS